MFESHLYEVDIHWEKGKIGEMTSPELDQKIKCATPPEFANGVPGVWSPEHLFTAAVSSCLMTTFLAVAENYKLKYEHFSCKAQGRLSKTDGKWSMSEIILKPELTICTEESMDKALKVLDKSEKACLISNSIKSMIVMNPNILISELCI